MAIPRNLANIAPHVNASSTELVVNDAGADLDFRVEGDTNANLIFADASADAVGIGTSSPSCRADIVGPSNATRGIVARVASDNGAYIQLVDSGSHEWYVGTLNGTSALVFGDSRNVTADGTERARITSGGDLLVGQASALPTGGRVQVVKDDSNAVIAASATDASYNYSNISVNVNRSASSDYIFFRAWSGNFGDVEFNLRGDGNGYADGTWNNNGADYAEFFESANGQALTLGATVVLDGNKVREATEQDPASAVIGVVRPKEPSKASMVIGNTAWNKWANKYLTDDFDRYIMEDHDVVEWTDEEGKQHSYESHRIPESITVPVDATIKTHDDKGNKFQHYKLNPAWNPDSEYVNRENRPEWNIIGLVGQVKVLKGQPTNDRWIKMRDVSETVAEWFIR
jgi:hypothetical protein